MIDLKVMFQRWLIASYSYYHLNSPFPVMTDEEYDGIAKELLESWDTFEHHHKYLVSIDDLKCGSLFAVKEEYYPRIVKMCARVQHNENMGVDYNVQSSII